jgi:carbon storage regulator
MLILSRKTDESIMIGDQIEISIVDIKGDHVKLGIKAPRSIKVYRQEVYRAIQQENIEAVKSKPGDLPVLDEFFGSRGDRKADAKSRKDDGK